MFSKKGIRALCMALFFCSSAALASLPVLTLTPDNCTFMLDIHDVLLDKNKEERKTSKERLIGAIKTAIWQDTKQFNPDGPFKLVPAILYLKVAYNGVSAEGYYHLLNQYHKHDCAELARDAARTYKPIKEMAAAVNTLHELGFPLRAGSNVGNTFYNDLVEDHPNVFEHFQAGTCVSFTHPDGSFNWNMVKKPSHDFFKQHYDKYVKGDSKEYCVFIDDKLENVEAARTFECENGHHPFIAFHFDRSLPTIKDSVTKLRTELLAYGIEI